MAHKGAFVTNIRSRLAKFTSEIITMEDEIDNILKNTDDADLQDLRSNVSWMGVWGEKASRAAASLVLKKK